MDAIAHALTMTGPDDRALLEDHGRLALALLPFLDRMAVLPMLRRAIQQEPALASLVTHGNRGLLPPHGLHTRDQQRTFYLS